ncbi:MAG: hypothetical protein AAFO70_08585, partial [Pseudomonadota bacterium]
MSLTKSEFDILADGGSVDFGLPADPGAISPDGIFFTNIFFTTTGGGNSGTVPQGVSSLNVVDDIGEFDNNAEFIVRNSTVTVGDDLTLRETQDSIISLSGSGTTVTMAGTSSSGSNDVRLSAQQGSESTNFIFVSDGASLVFADVANKGKSINVGVNEGAEQDGATIEPGGKSVDSTMIIEGAGTTVSIPDSGGDRGTMTIGQIRDAEDGVVDPTTGRTADALVVVRDGAQVDIRQNVQIGRVDDDTDGDATGALIVEGTGTVFNIGQTGAPGNAGFMRVAENGGTGYLVIRDGAQFNMLASTEREDGIQLSGASDRPGGEAHAVVTGSGTRLFIEEGYIDVGNNDGTATFELSDGAELAARRMSVALGGTAEAVITGAGTIADFTQGDGNVEIATLDDSEGRSTDVTGTLTVSDGASVEVGGFVGIADTRGVEGGSATGTLIIEGAGTEFSVGSDDGTGDDGFMRVA